MKEIINLLHTQKCSCVIAGAAGEIRSFHQRGVADLYTLLCQEPQFLHGASVADKVVGKAAAALMVKGQIKELHTDTISTPALKLLQAAHIPVEYTQAVPYIRNCDNTGWCPLETRCYEEDSIDILFTIIDRFIKSKI